ncbi:Alpha/beta hydrolase [Sulfidibacter corallicola]|uniref:Alpha/beta hydrolase n=1 Tax=Sulfidibacter corallicola TaxID=2818388 RepID=A0A8A4TGT8_SULCO|nr:alpha/beta hydrolase [Sulfidibacter corallicola]QTD49136.1 alpha/beta hydrolase [Sulfidibacter corallicola]
MKSTKLQFTNANGEKLAARLDSPKDTDPKAYALFAHCFTCSKNLAAVGHISRALTGAGYGVLRFDFTGLGESEGQFGDTNFSSNLLDLEHAAQLLAETRQAPKLLIGHSLGGAAVLNAAGKLESIRAVATIGAPAHPVHVKHLVQEQEEEIRDRGQATVCIGGRPFEIREHFLDDLLAHDAARNIGRLGKALLVCHAPFDQIVGIDNAADIFQAAKHPKSFLSLDNADHLLSRAEDARYAGAMIASWAARYTDD